MVNKDLLPLQIECTILFQENPYMIESLEGIQQRIGRRKEVLSPVLDQMVYQGILEKIGDDSSPLYRYQEPVVLTKLEPATSGEDT